MKNIKTLSALVLSTAAACGVAEMVTPNPNQSTSTGSMGPVTAGNGGNDAASSSTGKGGDYSVSGGMGGAYNPNGGNGGLGGVGGSNIGGSAGSDVGGSQNVGNGGSAGSLGGFGGAGTGGSNAGGDDGGNMNAGGQGGFGGADGAGGYAGAAGNGGAGGSCGDFLGKFTTYSQGGWHNTAASLLPGILSSGDVVIGDENLDYAKFTTPSAITNFLPAMEMPGALQGQYTNPLTTPAGVLAGQTLTLKLNLAVSNEVCGYTLDDLIITKGACKDKSVAEALDLADQALAGTSVSLSYSDLNKCVEGINLNFKEGSVDNHYLKLP